MNLLCPDDKENQPVPPYCAGQLRKERCTHDCHGEQEDLSLWDLPNAQLMPPTLVPRSRPMEGCLCEFLVILPCVGQQEPKSAKEPEKFHSVSHVMKMSTSLLNEKMDVDSQSNASQRLDRISDSLKALPDRISRMEEQWRDALQEIKRFTTHSDACMGTMRLEILEVKKLALRDSDSVRDLATEAKFQTDIQAVDLEAMQKKLLCLHDEQLRQVESQIREKRSQASKCL